LGIIVGGLLAVGGCGWLLWRRRRSGSDQ
jgi:LPXTG-motif cell wall-anchored protein